MYSIEILCKICFTICIIIFTFCKVIDKISWEGGFTMDKKLMWFFVLLLTLLTATVAAEYFSSGSFNLAYLLGEILGTSILWYILSAPKKRWLYWVSMLSWVLFIPGVTLGLVNYIAKRLSIEITTFVYVVIYLLGALVMLFFFIRTRPRSEIREIINRPVIDERYKNHFGVSSFWSFLFVNLLLIAALLQPWIPHSQLGLWIGVMIAGLVFWFANLAILERKR
jgi:hypothetical protein